MVIGTECKLPIREVLVPCQVLTSRDRRTRGYCKQRIGRRKMEKRLIVFKIAGCQNQHNTRQCSVISGDIEVAESRQNVASARSKFKSGHFHTNCRYTAKHCYVIALAQMSGVIKAKIFSNFLQHLYCHYQIFFRTYFSNLIQRSETRYISKYGDYKMWKIVSKHSELLSEHVCTFFLYMFC